MRKLNNNYIIFQINNVSYIVTNIYYSNDKEIITFSYALLKINTPLKYCYKINDMNEFIMFKKYIIDITINGTTTFKTIDLSSINLL